MRTTIILPEKLLNQAVELTGAKSRSEAVRRSIEELIARRRLGTFLNECGSFGFSDTWEKQRNLDAKSTR